MFEFFCSANQRYRRFGLLVLALCLCSSWGEARGGGIRALFAFDGVDGQFPYGNLTEDAGANLFGTTIDGGPYGSGTIFRVAPDGTQSVLYSFTGGKDGNEPVAGLIEDANGNLYGTTLDGGKYQLGTVFELAPDGTETVLYSFTGEAIRAMFAPP